MKWFKSLSEPMKIAVITGIFAIIAAVVGSLMTGIFVLTSTLGDRTPSLIINSPTVTVQTITTSTAIVSPTLVPSPTLIPNPYSPYTGRLVLNDPLKDNSKGSIWDEGSTTYGNCTFQHDNTYHVFSIPNDYHRCAAEKTGFSNFTFQVSLTIMRGYCGGMIFRADAQSLNYYYFTICQNDTYNFAIYTNGSEKLLQNAVSDPNIHMGLGQANFIAVVAMNNTISLFVNNSQAIYTTSESNFSQGQIGLVAESDGNDPSDISFSNAYVWAS